MSVIRQANVNAANAQLADKTRNDRRTAEKAVAVEDAYVNGKQAAIDEARYYGEVNNYMNAMRKGANPMDIAYTDGVNGKALDEAMQRFGQEQGMAEKVYMEDLARRYPQTYSKER